MTTIVELPDEPRFTIKAVASQTGIRPVTLRAWERRHEVLNPHRSENHYRLYSERDIAILRWLKHRVDEGSSIGSAVSELRRMAHNSSWPEALPLAPVQNAGIGVSPSANHATLLAQALIKHDENWAADLLRDIHARYDILTTCMEVLIPAIQEIEEAWNERRISIEIRRFTQAYLREKLLSLLCAYPSRSNAPLIMVGCAPMEINELSTLMLAVILRSDGYRVEYLGPDIATEDLADYSSYTQPSMVILSANSGDTAREMRRMQSMLSRIRSAPIFGYTGLAFAAHASHVHEAGPELRKEIPGEFLGVNLDSSLESIRYLLRTRRKVGHRSV